jgi:hypothetical protein
VLGHQPDDRLVGARRDSVRPDDERLYPASNGEQNENEEELARARRRRDQAGVGNFSQTRIGEFEICSRFGRRNSIEILSGPPAFEDEDSARQRLEDAGHGPA